MRDHQSEVPEAVELHSLGQYEVAYLTGGEGRVALTAVVALVAADAIRLSNPAAPVVVERMRAAGDHPTLRLGEAWQASRKEPKSGPALVTRGSVEPTHPVEREVAATLLRAGFLDVDSILNGPCVRAIPGRLAELRIRTAPVYDPDFLRTEVELWALLVPLTVTMAAWVAVVAATGLDHVPYLLTASWCATLGGALWARRRKRSDRAAVVTLREIERRLEAAGLHDILLTAKVTGYPTWLPSETVACVALQGELALWVADPALAASLGRLGCIDREWWIDAFAPVD